MQPEIVLLLQIQEKDIAIRSLEREQKMAPEALNETKKIVEQADIALKQKKEQLKNIQVTHKGLEIDLDSKMGNVKKLDTQLAQVKTNEQYKALQKEINDLKFGAGLQEDKILEKMEETEMIQKEIEKLKEDVDKTKEDLKRHEKEVKSKLESINSQMSQAKKEREELTSNVSKSILDRYNRIFNNKHDAAIVAVANNSCGGCHMKLPPNVVNEVRKRHNIILCENCARILYWSTEKS